MYHYVSVYEKQEHMRVGSFNFSLLSKFTRVRDIDISGQTPQMCVRDKASVCVVSVTAILSHPETRARSTAANTASVMTTPVITMTMSSVVVSSHRKVMVCSKNF